MSFSALNELEIAERERIVREMNQRRHVGKRSCRLDLKPIAEALGISRTGLRTKIRQLRITSEDLHICAAPDWLVRLTCLLPLLFSACAHRPPAPPPVPPAPARAVPATRTFALAWDPWACPLPARVFVQWCSEPSFSLQPLAFSFPASSTTGQITVPLAANNYFRSGYTLTK